MVPPVAIPDDVVWVKCYDPANQAFYYLHYSTQESVWEIPGSTSVLGTCVMGHPRWSACVHSDGDEVVWP